MVFPSALPYRLGARMALQDHPNRDRLPRGSNALEPEELARRHRERLQEALVVRVAANGLFDTTIRDICTEAQVAARDLYALYPGKDELLLATCDAIIARTSRQLDAARPSAAGAPARCATRSQRPLTPSPSSSPPSPSTRTWS